LGSRGGHDREEEVATGGLNSRRVDKREKNNSVAARRVKDIV